MNVQSPFSTEKFSKNWPTWRYSVQPAERAETEVDIGTMLLTLVRGWKIILSAALIGGLLGAWVVRVAPSRYEAKMSLAVVPSEDIAPVGNAVLSVPKPSLELLQQYASQILSSEVLDEAANQLREESAALETLTAEDLSRKVAIDPLKDEGRLVLSAVAVDPEQAKVLVTTIAQSGAKALEEFRTHQKEAIQKYLKARVDSAERAYQESQQECFRLQAEQKYTEKSVQLQETNRRLTLLQQTLMSAEMEIPKLQARIRTWEALLSTLPETTTQTFRCKGDEWLRLLKGKLPEDKPTDTDTKDGHLEFLWETASLTRQSVEKNLLEDRAALQALQTSLSETQKTLPEYLTKMDQAQTEMDAVNSALTLARARLQTAQNRYTTAQGALAKWGEDAVQTFPPINLPESSAISVQTKGLSSTKRWIGIESLALCVGGLAVFLIEGIRRRKQVLSLPPQDKLPTLTSEEQQMIMSQKMPA